MDDQTDRQWQLHIRQLMEMLYERHHTVLCVLHDRGEIPRE